MFTTSSTTPKASQRRMSPRSLISARQQLPALPAVVERDRQVLQLRVEGVAHRRLDVRAGRQHEPAARQDQAGLERAEHQHDDGRRPDLGAVAGRQRTVDEALQHERDAERDERGEERRDHAEHDAGQGGAHEGIDPHDGADGSAGVRSHVGRSSVRHGYLWVERTRERPDRMGWWRCGRGRGVGRAVQLPSAERAGGHGDGRHDLLRLSVRQHRGLPTLVPGPSPDSLPD